MIDAEQYLNILIHFLLWGNLVSASLSLFSNLLSRDPLPFIQLIKFTIWYSATITYCGIIIIIVERIT